MQGIHDIIHYVFTLALFSVTVESFSDLENKLSVTGVFDIIIIIGLIVYIFVFAAFVTERDRNC